jgi:nicotinamide-nucleotide amidase
MKIILIAIGNEILSGHTVNTNATFLSQELLKNGYSINQHLVIQDDKKIIQKVLKAAIKKYDLVIVTGGIGPTIDDKTKAVLAEIFSSPVKLNEEIYADLLTRYPHLKTLQEQANIPEKAYCFKNSLGTAYGMAFNEGGKYLLSLPGVPQEMKEMFIKEALPFILEKFPLQKKIYEKNLYFSILEEITVDPLLRKLEQENPDIQIGIYPSYGYLHVRLSCLAKNSIKAEKKLTSVFNTIKEEWKDYFYSETSSDISLALHQELINRQEKIALAESCTGGLIASSIAQHPGASTYFLGSFVVYANEMKKNLLNVQKSTLENYGAVSKETVKEMLEGIFNHTSATWALAISGIAGPTGETPGKPVGTLCIGIAQKNGSMDMKEIHFKGTREMVMLYGKNYALSLLYQKLKKTH